MTTFFDTIKRELIITAMALVVFSNLFVFNLPYYAYFLGSGIMLFIMVIYWFIALSEFKSNND